MTEVSGTAANSHGASSLLQDGVVTEQDLCWVFQELDPSNTGFVRVDEFYKFLTKDQPPRHHIEDTAMYIMGLFGNTKPGHLSRSEAAGYVNLCKNGTREDQYCAIFKDAGRRKPGLLSRSELSDLIETKYNQTLKPDFEDVFDHCDDDMDGFLTLAEFIQFVETYEL